MNIINEVKDYLFNEQIRAIDVVLISLITSLILWLTSSVFKIVGKVFMKWFETMRRYYRLIVKNELGVMHHLKIEEKLANDKKLRWYEKKAYEMNVKSFEEAMKKNLPIIQRKNNN